MRRHFTRRLGFLAATVMALLASRNAAADPADTWWDEGWPYRVPVAVSGSGVTTVTIDFTSAFRDLGADGALLDIHSIRVVPY